MIDRQKTRLSNRILTCKNELEVARRNIALHTENLRFWRNELQAAEAEFHGFKQGELNLTGLQKGE